MTKRRKSIKLFPHERQALIDVYLKWGFAVDTYERLPDELEAMVGEWQDRCARTDAPQDVLHYMRNERKCSRWVRFDGKHKDPPPMPKFTAEETEVLVELYRANVAELDAGSDTLGYDTEVAESLAREFAKATGRVVPAHYCVAKLTALRKRGLLPKASRPEGFGDLDQAQPRQTGSHSS